MVTIATAEAEAVCLRNGLLLHELLRLSYYNNYALKDFKLQLTNACFDYLCSPFGHLDSINSVIRIGTASIATADAHIRFERATELKSKGSELIEEVRHALILLIIFLYFYLNVIYRLLPDQCLAYLFQSASKSQVYTVRHFSPAFQCIGTEVLVAERLVE